MNLEAKQIWLERLRSGTISQGQGILGTNDKRCCLGVLCDIAVEKGVIPTPRLSGSEARYYGSVEEYQVLPIEVKDWAGLKDGNPHVDMSEEGRIREGPLHSSLAYLNDHGASFAEIADLIEAQL